MIRSPKGVDDGALLAKAWRIINHDLIKKIEEDEMTEVTQLVWRDPDMYKPNDGQKVLCVTKTKKGATNCVMGYYDKEIGWVCGMCSNVVAWAFVYPPEWSK